jgi:hypothetical protein
MTMTETEKTAHIMHTTKNVFGMVPRIEPLLSEPYVFEENAERNVSFIRKSKNPPMSADDVYIAGSIRAPPQSVMRSENEKFGAVTEW